MSSDMRSVPDLNISPLSHHVLLVLISTIKAIVRLLAA